MGWDAMRETLCDGRKQGIKGFSVPLCLCGLLPLDVLLQDALVHHDKDACLARSFRCFVMDHAFLHPDDGSLDLDGLPDHFGDGFGSQKTAYDIDLLRN